MVLGSFTGSAVAFHHFLDSSESVQINQGRVVAFVVDPSVANNLHEVGILEQPMHL